VVKCDEDAENGIVSNILDRAVDLTSNVSRCSLNYLLEKIGELMMKQTRDWRHC
jgi:hypothetical protein